MEERTGRDRGILSERCQGRISTQASRLSFLLGLTFYNSRFWHKSATQQDACSQPQAVYTLLISGSEHIWISTCAKMISHLHYYY